MKQSPPIPLVISLALFLSMAYFYQGGGWNPNSRMNLVRSLGDEGSWSVDTWAHNTGDRAKFGEHYYSDKAPGVSYLALPFYSLYRLFFGTPSSDRALMLASFLCVIMSISLPLALSAGLYFRYLH